jgi:meiotically up-regulated gene 157 (Mug157) protein
MNQQVIHNHIQLAIKSLTQIESEREFLRGAIKYSHANQALMHDDFQTREVTKFHFIVNGKDEVVTQKKNVFIWKNSMRTTLSQIIHVIVSDTLNNKQ